jgi:hypothetical protein
MLPAGEILVRMVERTEHECPPGRQTVPAIVT